MKTTDIAELQRQIPDWATALGFDQIGFTDTDLSAYTPDYLQWLSSRFYGDMSYMSRNVEKRTDPAKLLPGTIRIISLSMNYLSEERPKLNADGNAANISRCAFGRDYHKTVRKRLNQLAKQIENYVSHQFRAFVDSAPVLEKPLAVKAGLGWIGKHTLTMNETAGSFFFLGEIFTNIPFQVNTEQKADRCGACQACINVCPTRAIIGPRQLDATRCISYLTIEHKGSIPIEFRKAIGNRIFGCDDCQLICPWNRFARVSSESDFAPRHGLDRAKIIDLLRWDEKTFLARTEGMALRRINFSQWLRNLAVAAGNAESNPELVRELSVQLTLATKRQDLLASEHLEWALSQHRTVTAGSESAPDRT